MLVKYAENFALSASKAFWGTEKFPLDVILPAKVFLPLLKFAREFLSTAKQIQFINHVNAPQRKAFRSLAHAC
jgi:hypothetical protein